MKNSQIVLPRTPARRRCCSRAGTGLVCGDHACTYGELIASAFGATPQPFSRVFGQAIAAYESTLIPDATPYDRFLRGDMHALTQRQRDGFDVFSNPLSSCINCHAGPELSDASLTFAAAHGLRNVDGGDQGFHHTGVRPTSALHSEDLGRAGLGRNQATYSISEAAADRGAFKTPQLRDVALTAPYFHNGGKATLDDVIDFYDGGGDFTASASQIHALILLPDNRQALLDFLQNALTDCRVANDRAPFDHPAIDVPNGPLLPAVGAEGDGPCP